MQVTFTPEQEAQLSELATHDGLNIQQLVKQAALRLLDEDNQFREAVRKGFAAIDRGEYIEEEGMDARVLNYSGIEKITPICRGSRRPRTVS